MLLLDSKGTNSYVLLHWQPMACSIEVQLLGWCWTRAHWKGVLELRLSDAGRARLRLTTLPPFLLSL